MSQGRIYAKLAYLVQHKISSFKKWENSKKTPLDNQLILCYYATVVMHNTNFNERTAGLMTAKRIFTFTDKYLPVYEICRDGQR